MKNNNLLHILFVENIPANMELAEFELRNEQIQFISTRVETKEEYLLALDKVQPDIIIFNFGLPVFDGLKAFYIAIEKAPNTPFFILTDSKNEEAAIEGMKAGAADYFFKEQLKRLPFAVKHALHGSERKFRALFQSMMEGVIYQNQNGEIIEANPMAEKLLGLTVAQMQKKEKIDQRWHLLKEDDVPCELKDLPLAIAMQNTKDNYHIMLKVYIPQIDQYRFLNVNSIPQFKNNETSPLLFFSTFEDITELKIAEIRQRETAKKIKQQNESFQILNEQLSESHRKISLINKELSEAKEKAYESDKLKTAFLCNISHEIRTPLNAVLGFLQMLFRPGMSVEKQEQYKDIIYKCSHQLIDTVNDLIEVSKIEVGSLSLFNSVFNVNELLRQVYYKYKDEADKKGIRFKLSIMFTDKDAVLHSDETKLSQIINYLVNNAIKFTKTGEITVGYTLKNQWTEFFVKDTGIGISTEHQSVIFKPFRQAEISRSRNYSGTGLGLSIAQGFVKKMGGQIWVESELNQGSCFYFKLPVVLKEEEPIVVDFCNPEALNYNFEGMTILIAEDDDFNLTFMIEMFIGTNMIIKKAKNGLEAIEMYQENTDIGLVLMDLKMPHMDGFEATKRLKSINKNLYIIAVTAFSLSEEKEYAIACGCDDVISKPVEQMVILKKIDQIRKRQV